MKRCSKCGVEKPETEFHKGIKYKDGLCYQCKECANNKTTHWARENRERHNANGRAYRLEHPEKIRAADDLWKKKNPQKVKAKDRRGSYRRRYGLTVPQFEALFLTQKGVCAICKEAGESKKRLSVDHIHGTNPAIVRGLLCQKCNHAIGLLRDSPQNCFAAANYLQQPKQISNSRVDSAGYVSPC